MVRLAECKTNVEPCKPRTTRIRRGRSPAGGDERKQEEARCLGFATWVGGFRGEEGGGARAPSLPLVLLLSLQCPVSHEELPTGGGAPQERGFGPTRSYEQFSEPKSKNGRRRPTGVLDHSARTTPAPHHVDLVAARTPLASPARGDRPYVADPRCRAGAVPEGAAAALPSGFCTRTTDGPDRDEDGSVHAEQMNSDVGEGASVAGKLRRAFCFWSYLSGSIFFAPQSRQIMTVTG
jgi:hypothetical protein